MHVCPNIYRDRIINKLWEDVFLDVSPAIYMRTGEIENNDRKNQKDCSRPTGQQRAIGWFHDAILMMKFLSKKFKLVLVRLLAIHVNMMIDSKMNEDRENDATIPLQLAKLLLERQIQQEDLKKLETFGILVYKRDFFIYSTHWVNGLYLVDQVNGFTIPNTANQLNELSIIINVMLEFKYRVINLKNHINSLLKDKPKFFGYRKTIGELAVDSSQITGLEY
ncbi:10409_t:CDS:2, partial [Funneliformis geosporum]